LSRRPEETTPCPSWCKTPGTNHKSGEAIIGRPIALRRMAGVVLSTTCGGLFFDLSCPGMDGGFPVRDLDVGVFCIIKCGGHET